jgi:hypothetical protein
MIDGQREGDGGVGGAREKVEPWVRNKWGTKGNGK